MKKALLVALNTKYIHSNLAVYCLKAYAAKKGLNVDIAEYTINNLKQDIVMDIYRRKPDFIGFSCYIWNINMVRIIAEEIKMLLPKTDIWFGGPEVSFDAQNEINENWYIDGIMIGEGEITFSELIDSDYENYPNIKGIVYRDKDEKIRRTECRDYIDMDEVPFIYDNMEDFQNRIVYYESSRGCPYSCSYCMSSVDKRVRYRSLELVKEELQFFLDKKVPQVKFVDRTFNCDKKRTLEIWKYINEHDNGITNFHFEISADILSDEEIIQISLMRPKLIQLEIGVQTTNVDTIKAINRKMDFGVLSSIVKKINSKGNIHQHLDLIAGLPYENLDSFKKSFNDVYALRPEQLQLGFLKVLKGSYMHEMAKEYGIVYQTTPPYEVLFTKWISYEDVILLKSVEEMVEVYYNSGQFKYTIRFLEHFFNTAFEMYEFFGQYYEENNLNGRSHSRIERYNILRKLSSKIFEKYQLAINDGSKNKITKDVFDKVICELMVHDLYLRENMKTRPEFAISEDLFRKPFNEFYKNEELVKSILKGYEEYTTKQIARMTHMEHYSFDLDKTCKNGKPIHKEKILMYDYNNRNLVNYDAKVIDVTNKVDDLIEKNRVREILRLLDEYYTREYKCYLNHDNAWQLLIATILSAQCTDERVNQVTKDLFVKYPSLEAFANADVKELEKDIYSTGFYKNKAKNIIECTRKIIDEYNSEVPDDLESLTSLAGVGRKTANVIRGNIFNQPSIVVDTHVKRISKKLGFTKEDDPVKIEYDLMKVLPKEHWILYNIQIITHGRTICPAIRPKCDECFLKELCKNT